jgi:O-antigen/teichoic acid export membrane protein
MIIFVAQIWQFAIIAIGKQKKLLLFFLGMALLAPVLYFFSITRYGYIGAAWVTVLVELIMTIVYGYILNMEKIKLFNQNTLKFILPIFIIGTTSLLIGDIQGLIFFIIITLTWIILCKKNKYYDILTLLKYLIS